jgi:SAM-dependent methyltransferase
VVALMVTIYQDYDDEPEPRFTPLSAARACRFYALEMAGFTADLPFYRRWLPPTGEILELGCGSGRLTRLLAGPQQPLTGVDISWPMLQLARENQSPHSRLVQMDIRKLAFSRPFAALLIPYNTLNLLIDRENILACLAGCHRSLRSGGLLLAEVHIPEISITTRQGKTFQFQILPRPEGGRIIKEVLRQYLPESTTLRVEERFRVRPEGGLGPNEDLVRHYTAAALTAEKWFELFTTSGFRILEGYASYALEPWRSGATSLLIVLAAETG